MKAYRVEILAIDFDNDGEKEIEILLNSLRLPNGSPIVTVMSIAGRDIGEWSDDHPLNDMDKVKAEYARLFSDQ